MNSDRRFPPAWRTFVVIALLSLAGAGIAYSPERVETRLVAGDGVVGPVVQTDEPGDEIADGGERVIVVERGGTGGAAGGGDAGDAIGGIESGTVVDHVDGLAGGGTQGPSGPVECAPGRNGGSTDVGVTGTAIKLGATVVDSGPGASFLRDARYGIQAIANKVNREGGICGRRLDVKLVDDEWEADRGMDFIRNFVEGEKVFALAVVPSSEGLNLASVSNYLREQKVPVVGSDGMLRSQYTDPYIWPVAASTVSTMRIMARNAYDRFGSRNFAIVYDMRYKFGVEGAKAFNDAVKRLTGENIPGFSDPERNPRCDRRFCGIPAAETSYTSQINTLNSACDNSDLGPPGNEGRCDFIALLLEPTTALTWIQQGGRVLSGGKTQGAQPLFNRGFAESCKRTCDGMWLWSGYVPAIGANLGNSAVAEYRDEIVRTNSSADTTNTFVQGAYIGMTLLVEALEEVGPFVTRERLVEVLNSMNLDTGLTAVPLRWSTNQRFANTTMQAYSIQYGDRFSGWRDEGVSVTDPCLASGGWTGAMCQP